MMNTMPMAGLTSSTATGDKPQITQIKGRWVMRKIMMLVLVCVIFGLTPDDMSGQRTPREEIAIVVVEKPQITQIKNPYQEEYEKMLYPTVRISTATGTGSGVIFETTDEHGLTQRSC